MRAAGQTSQIKLFRASRSVRELVRWASALGPGLGVRAAHWAQREPAPLGEPALAQNLRARAHAFSQALDGALLPPGVIVVQIYLVVMLICAATDIREIRNLLTDRYKANSATPMTTEDEYAGVPTWGVTASRD